MSLLGQAYCMMLNHIGAMHHPSIFGMLPLVGTCFTAFLQLHKWRVMQKYCTVISLFQQKNKERGWGVHTEPLYGDMQDAIESRISKAVEAAEAGAPELS